MSNRFKFCLSLWCAVVAISIFCGQTFAQEIPVPLAPKADPGLPIEVETLTEALNPTPRISDADWKIEITPALKVRSSTAAQAVSDDAAMSPEQVASAYRKIYDSIPFNRVEYNRNPTYRHDSTMEILTGNARHKTIVRHQPRVIQQTSRRSTTFNPYQFGYLRPALRLNYYRYFPSMNPYLNAYNLSGAY